MLKAKIVEQIEDIRNPMLFAALQVEGHALDRHLLSDNALRQALRLKGKPKYLDDIIKVTRFFDEGDALNLIADTLTTAISDIERWLLSDIEDDLTIKECFERATGDGLVKNTDWSQTISMHAVTVVLRKNFRKIGRSFVVVTAYPSASLDDNDVIYDAMDAYATQKQKN